MNNTKKCDDSRQLHNDEGHLQKNRVELEKYIGAPSISLTLEKEQDAESMKYQAIKIKQIAIGWINYFKLADMKSTLREFDEWLRRRIRMCYWKQWKKIKTKHDNLRKLGISNSKAWEYANTRKGYWRISNSPILARTLTNKYLKEQGFIALSEIYLQLSNSY